MVVENPSFLVAYNKPEGKGSNTLYTKGILNIFFICVLRLFLARGNRGSSTVFKEELTPKYLSWVGTIVYISL